MKKFLRETKAIIAFLTEQDYEEYQVYAEKQPGATALTFNIQVPTPLGIYVNKIFVPEPLTDSGRRIVVARMAELARTRPFPDGSFFITPWGEYFINNGMIGKL